MRLEIKKWGNGIAVRLPRESTEFGRLEPGMEIDVEIGARKPKKDWEPYVVDLGPADLSERHREYTAKLLGRKPWYEELES